MVSDVSAGNSDFFSFIVLAPGDRIVVVVDNDPDNNSTNTACALTLRSGT